MTEYTIEVGLRRAGYVEFESNTLPEYSMGMLFILTITGQHFAFSLTEVSAVIATPVSEDN